MAPVCRCVPCCSPAACVFETSRVAFNTLHFFIGLCNALSGGHSSVAGRVLSLNGAGVCTGVRMSRFAADGCVELRFPRDIGTHQLDQQRQTAPCSSSCRKLERHQSPPLSSAQATSFTATWRCASAPSQHQFCGCGGGESALRPSRGPQSTPPSTASATGSS